MDNYDNDYGQGYVITACDSPDGAFIQDALHVEPDTRRRVSPVPREGVGNLLPPRVAARRLCPTLRAPG